MEQIGRNDMKILILTTSHPFQAAGIVAYDLLKGLSSIEGNDVKILVKAWDNFEDSRIIPIETAFEHYLYAIIRRIKRFRKKTLKFIFKNYKTKDEKLKDKINSDYYFEYDMSKTFYSTKKILKRAGFKPDCVLVLFMTEFISFKELYELNKITEAKIFLYPMDMASYTGGCHYAWGCIGYTKECGSCPAIYSSNQNDQTRVNYMFKKMFIEKTNIIPIAATEYQYNQLKASSLFKKTEKCKILLPVNEELFKPTKKDEARKKLKLPLGGKIIFFGAFSINEKRKGFKELIEILRILKNKVRLTKILNIHLVVIGNNFELINDILPFEYTTLGYLAIDQVANVFQAADLFVCPSIQDSGPIMINQAIMSGTPVVSFEMGVSLDLVHSRITGCQVKLGEFEKFAEEIFKILSLGENDYFKIAENCRKLALKEYSIKIVAEKLLLYLNQQSIK